MKILFTCPRPSSLFLLLATLAWRGTAQTNSFPSSGNVGIGTANPETELHISSGSPVVKIQNSSYEDTSDSFYGWIGGYDKSDDEVWWLGEGSGGSKLLGFFTNRTGYDLKLFNQGAGISIVNGGNVGIGVTNPQAKLQVGLRNLIKDGTWGAPSIPGTDDSPGERVVFYQDLGWKTAIGMGVQNGIWFQSHTPSGQVAYQWFTGLSSSAPTERMRIMESGNVGIGTSTPENALDVAGTIRAEEIIVEAQPWADHVFAEGYRLAPLSEVESHIREHGRLPGVPSAAEVAERGASVGDTQRMLLEKVEELTLHVIELEKRNAELEKRLESMELGSRIE